MSAAGIFSEGNEAFVDEEYDKAVKKYTEAIKLDPSNAEYFLKRAAAYMKLEDYENGVKDAEKSVEIKHDNPKAHIRKGTAYFGMEEYKMAKDAFSDALKLDSESREIKTWIRKCEAELDLQETEKNIESSGGQTISLGISSGVPAVSEEDQLPQKNTEPSGGTTKKPCDLMPPQTKAKYDWYQTEKHIILTILIKNVNKDVVNVEYQEKNLSATVRLPSGNDYSLELDLAHPIVPNDCITRVLTSKIELKMKKAEGIRWSCLETDNESQFANTKEDKDPPKSADKVRKYPTSSHKYHDWDKMAAELSEQEKTENLEGDAALNKLFQDIYAKADDDTKRAMNKSFVESGGTVLSTNWKEIGKNKVDCKPPDGMEFKKYEF